MVQRKRSRALRPMRAGVAVTTALGLLAMVSAPTTAHHDLYRRVSAGARLGNGAFAVTFLATSTDGKRALFSSTERLVAADTDSSTDIYERSGGSTKRVSAGAINGNGAFNAGFAKSSSDGTRVFFITGEQLVAGDTDSQQDIYERSAGVTTLASAGAINGNGGFSAVFRGISSDGTRVYFTTGEKLVATDTDNVDDLYERSGGTTTLVSVGQINGNLAFFPGFAGASASGARVWFTTQEKLAATDTDNNFDIYERTGGQTFRISRGAINGNGAFDANFAGASSDGSRVFFTTPEQLVAADTDGVSDIYEFSPGGIITQMSAGAINGNGPHGVLFSGATPDGTRVFFSTTEQLATGDTDTAQDIYTRFGGVTSRVTVGAINGNGAVNASFSGVSADGLRVFFTTAEALAPTDTDGSTDLYELSAGTTKHVSPGTINGNGVFDAAFADISADGTRVFFTTAEDLAGDDDDSTRDIYERTAGQTLLVTIGAGEVDVSYKDCSSDGLAVFFETTEKLLASDKDAVTDIYGAYDAF